MGEDAHAMDPMKLIRPTSPKLLIKPERQKQFFQEAAEKFSQLGGNKGIELQKNQEDNETQSSSEALIQEWFHLFLKIVNNAPMLERLKQNLEGMLKKNTGAKESAEVDQKYV